jgi:hypothetical protein
MSSGFPEYSPDVGPRLSPRAAAIVADLRAKQALDLRILVSRQTSMAMLGVGQTRQIELEKTELDRVQDGASVRITTSSIYARLVRLAVQSHPLDGLPTRVRRPPGMKRRRRPTRKRTENELAALQRANLKRHDDAQASRLGAGDNSPNSSRTLRIESRRRGATPKNHVSNGRRKAKQTKHGLNQQ